MAVEEIILRIIGDSKSGEGALNRVNQRLLSFGGMLTAASDAALITFARLGEGGAKIEALEAKFDRMARSFGKSSEEMLAAWEEASAGTLSRAEMMAKANQAALLGLPVDRLADLLAIARNASEATGESVAYMFDSLVTGIGRQSKMVLDNLGIVFTADEAYKSYAASIGKSADALNAQEKQAAFLEATLRAASRQQQMLGAATENASTKIARAKAALSNAKDEIQKAFVPVAVKLYGIVEALAKAFSAIPEPIKRAGASLAASAAGLGAIVGPVMTLKGLLPLIKGAMAALGGGAASSILPIIAVVLAVIGVIKLAAKAWQENWGGIRDTVQSIVNVIKPILDGIVADVKYWIGAIKQEFAGIMAAVRGLIEPALARLRGLFGDGAGIAQFMTTVRDAVSVVLSTIRNLLTALRKLLEGNADEAWSPLKDAALNVITLIVIGWRKYVSKAISFGWNLVVNLANGIINAAKTVLTAAANFIGKIIGRFLAPGSPPKEGPLRGIVRWGKGLMDTFLRSFKLADFGILRDALGPLRQALDSAVEMGDIGKVDALKIFSNVRQDVAALIAGFRKTGEISEEALSKISEQLGEGGKDYVVFLRRTLEHQQALDKLKKAQDAVAAAQKKGWVPKALEDQLSAAEEEAAAAEDRLNWQREYLEALQSGVDLQREMIDAMRELAEAIGGGGGGGGAGEVGAPDMGGGGAISPEGLDLGGTEEAFAGFGGFSEGFNQVKEEVKAWFEGLPGKISSWMELAKASLVTKWTETKEELKNIPVLGSIVTWLEEKLPAAIDTAKAFWDDTFKPALDSVVAFIADNVLPIFGNVADWLENALKTAIDAAKSLWEDVLKPAMGIVYDFVKDDLLPMFEAIGDFFDAVFTLAVTAMAGLWQNVLKPALEGVWSLIKDSLQPVLDVLKKFFDETLKPVLETIADVITNVLQVAWDGLIKVFTDAKTGTLDKIKQVFDDIGTVVGNVTDFFAGLAEKIKGLSLPDWLTPGSPTPLETGLQGIIAAVRRLSGAPLSALADQLQRGLPDLSVTAGLRGTLGGLSLAGAGAAVGQGGLVQNINVFVGENAMPMPNVRDGRDMESIQRQLEDTLYQAMQKAAVPGGVPGGG